LSILVRYDRSRRPRACGSGGDPACGGGAWRAGGGGTRGGGARVEGLDVTCPPVKAGEEAIHAAPNIATNYAKLADLYIFEMDWLTPAIALYEKAASLAPGELTYRWRLMDLYLNDSRADKMLSELEYLARRLPSDEQTQNWYRAYRRYYDFGDD
jgi:hypothetical protein